MKNKMKKILAGICAGVALGTCGIFAGCTTPDGADITVKQSDVDSLFTQAAEYAGDFSKYLDEYTDAKYHDTDYVINRFMDAYATFKVNFKSVNAFTLNTSSELVDCLGNLSGDYFTSETIQMYKSENTTKFYEMFNNGPDNVFEQYSFINKSGDKYIVDKYITTNDPYEQELHSTKYHNHVENVKLSELYQNVPSEYYQLLALGAADSALSKMSLFDDQITLVLGNGNDSEINSIKTASMSMKSSGTIEYRFVIRYDETDSNDNRFDNMLLFGFEFTNGLLTQCTADKMNDRGALAFDGLGGSDFPSVRMNSNMTIEYNTGDIVVDTTEYADAQ